jgi:type IV pilus assembly protein PilQ
MALASLEGLEQPAAAQSTPSPSAGSRTVRVVNPGALELKVRRLPDRVELVIDGVGRAPQLQQTTQGTTWMGRLLTSTPSVLRRGPQRLALPEAGLESISINGAGTEYLLQVTPSAGSSIRSPEVSADGRSLIISFSAPDQASLQTMSPDLRVPGRVAQPGFVPPLQPRAVAPPVGDMAVGTMMLSNPSYVNVSGPPVTMTLNQAPAKDVLMALSRLGGYGFVFVDDPQSMSGRGGGNGGAAPAALRPISITFSNENYGRAINSALLAAGLQGKREGNMILAGPNVLGKSFGAQMSKVYRLNQASASSAADYLANLGATINKTFTTTSVTSDIQSAGTAQVGSATQTSATATTTQIESYGASQGPLRGLIGTTDSRLGTITLVGDPGLVAIAENYLRQLDLRQRQVALSVRVLDLSYDNAQEIANSFALRWGNNFIVNDQGRLVGAFGRYLPPTAGAVGAGVPENISESSFSSSSNSSSSNSAASESLQVTPESFNLNLSRDASAQQNANASSDQFRGSSSFGSRTRNLSTLYPRDNFLDFIQAQIVSRSAKLLASPTIILQENPSLLRESGGGGAASDSEGGLDAYTIDSPIGRRRANEAVVRVGTNVITNVDVEAEDGGVACTLELSTSGLTLGARVDKIDDNGFVTFSLSPSVSAVTDTVAGPPLCTNAINILSVRRLDTGSVRVRDGQTLVLTGVISDNDRSELSKWPILGDVPLIGQFFRASSNTRQKRELVILVTPRIIDDEQGGTYGYGVQSDSATTRRFMSQPSF